MRGRVRVRAGVKVACVRVALEVLLLVLLLLLLHAELVLLPLLLLLQQMVLLPALPLSQLVLHPHRRALRRLVVPAVPLIPPQRSLLPSIHPRPRRLRARVEVPPLHARERERRLHPAGYLPVMLRPPLARGGVHVRSEIGPEANVRWIAEGERLRRGRRVCVVVGFTVSRVAFVNASRHVNL